VSRHHAVVRVFSDDSPLILCNSLPGVLLAPGESPFLAARPLRTPFSLNFPGVAETPLGMLFTVLLKDFHLRACVEPLPEPHVPSCTPQVEKAPCHSEAVCRCPRQGVSLAPWVLRFLFSQVYTTYCQRHRCVLIENAAKICVQCVKKP
jgi:hypothetical protein